MNIKYEQVNISQFTATQILLMPNQYHDLQNILVKHNEIVHGFINVYLNHKVNIYLAPNMEQVYIMVSLSQNLILPHLKNNFNMG